MFKKLNTDNLQVNCKRYSLKNINALGLRQSTIVAHRLSIHFQNILTPSKNPQKCIDDINIHIALFRDLLILMGQAKDCPEMRVKIRKLRGILMEECKNATDIFISQVICSSDENTAADNRYLVLLFQLMQLFLRELNKNYHLLETIPMDFRDNHENHAGPSNVGNAISEILLYKQLTPDFAQEELSKITNESQEVILLCIEIEKYIPQELNQTLDIQNYGSNKRKRNFFSKKFSLLCCVDKSN